MTKLMESLALSTPDAYNIFGTSVNSQATIDSIREDLTRYTKSTLATYDFRFSKGEFVELPGGWLGFAAGIEARRETQPDDRDPRKNGRAQCRERECQQEKVSVVAVASKTQSSRSTIYINK